MAKPGVPKPRAKASVRHVVGEAAAAGAGTGTDTTQSSDWPAAGECPRGRRRQGRRGVDRAARRDPARPCHRVQARPALTAASALAADDPADPAPARVDPDDEAGLRYWRAHFGVTVEQLLEAVQAVGGAPQAVREHLLNQGSSAGAG